MAMFYKHLTENNRKMAWHAKSDQKHFAQQQQQQPKGSKPKVSEKQTKTASQLPALSNWLRRH
eukprot:NODE_4668_length_778_cov_2.234568_g3881_i0.p3 GENE.NODE_4668_length_778_cov_2.234568_g3881_i0~~NODE_4668_length_778_cov_2.234568_g3881_i0.p3  ORF type:complete len:63 (-),score=6.25 NODE_4668_length_778_cov_2.234568_g3881_i0:357-545(-)